jgi:hypothetical protein
MSKPVWLYVDTSKQVGDKDHRATKIIERLLQVEMQPADG